MRNEIAATPSTETVSVLSALVRDHAGVLVRVAELFSRRGYNIDGLTVGPTAAPGMSRMTISLRATSADIEQVQRQLGKLVDVAAVRLVAPSAGVFRELALVKVAAGADLRAQVIQVAEVFRARVVDVSPETLTLEVTGDGEKIDGLIEVLTPYGIRELARTGLAALERGSDSLSLS